MPLNPICTAVLMFPVLQQTIPLAGYLPSFQRHLHSFQDTEVSLNDQNVIVRVYLLFLYLSIGGDQQSTYTLFLIIS